MKAAAFRLALVTSVLACGLSQAYAQSAFTTPDPEFKGNVSASAAERGTPLHAGSPVVLSGKGFTPGQSVTIWRGAAELTFEPLKADGKGEFRWTTTIPSDAEIGQHQLVVNADNPAGSAVFKIKVSPNVGLFGDDKFDAKSQKLVRGLYQVAYSAKNDALFVTSSVGRPPVEQSALLKIDPATLEISTQITPASAPKRSDGKDGGVFAVYGVGVDDSKDTVWVTNTRQNTVAVYNQSDLSLVKQFDAGLVRHARDIVIDEARHHAFASAARSSKVAVFDTEKLEPLEGIEIATTKPGSRFDPQAFGASGMDLDEEAGKLFVASMTTNELAIIDLDKLAVEKVIPVKGALTAMGVAYDHESGYAYVVAQGSDNLLIVDTKSGETLYNVPVGAGALNVTFDPVNKLAFVSSRGAGTVTAVSPDGEIVANLDNGSNPNHLTTDGKGEIFAVNKSRGDNDPVGDRITRIAPSE